MFQSPRLIKEWIYTEKEERLWKKINNDGAAQDRIIDRNHERRKEWLLWNGRERDWNYGKEERNNNRRLDCSSGSRSNGFLGLSLDDGTIIFLDILLDKTVSVG